MPSKGSPVLKFRVMPLLMCKIDEAIEQHNKHSADEPWDRSDFGRHCVMMYFKWKARVKKAAAKRKAVKS